MKQKTFRRILICLIIIYATTAAAQQSKVDSVILYLNKSFATDKLDSASYRQVFALLRGISITDSQIAQVENTLSSFKNWTNKENPHFVRTSILNSLSNNDVDKAISYGKQQIELLEKINTPWASSIKSYYNVV